MSHGNEVSQWLQIMDLKDPNNVNNVFSEFGLETLDDLMNLDAMDILEIHQNIKKIVDRHTIKKQLDILRSRKIKPFIKKIMVKDTEELHLKKLQKYMKKIDSFLNDIADVVYSIENDANKAKKVINNEFNKFYKILENRQKIIINNINKRKESITKNFVDDEKKLTQKHEECSKLSVDVQNKVYKIPIHPADLNARADKISNTIKECINDKLPNIPKNKWIYVTNDTPRKLITSQLIQAFKCPISFDFQCESFDTINIDYYIDHALIPKIDNHNCKIQVVYQGTNNNDDDYKREQIVTPTKHWGKISVEFPFTCLWSFKLRFFDGNTNEWSMYSDTKSVDTNSIIWWETDRNWKSKNIIIKSHTIIEVLWTNYFDYPSIYLTDIIKSGIHKYEFKILKHPKKFTWGVLFGLYGTGTMPDVEQYFKGNQPKPNYAFNSKAYIRRHSSIYVYNDSYGIKLHENSNIAMVIDLKKNELSYIINGKNFGKACNIMGNTSYKIGITLETHEYSVQFVSHKIL